MRIFKFFLICSSIILLYNFKSDFKKYCNERFKYCIEYPSNFIGKGESSNGDGEIFVSSDRQTTITTYGFLVYESNGFTDNLDSRYRSILKNKNVTYKLKTKDFFIVSGFENDGKIFYQKSKKSKDYYTPESEIVKTVEIVYPKSQTRIYNEYCKKISKSL